MRIFWTLIYFCLATSFIGVSAVESTRYSPTSDNSLVHSDFITVTLDQIYLTNDGMFVEIDQEFLPIYALYSNGDDKYRCDVHNRIEDMVTCGYCGSVYDRHKYKKCPNTSCPSKNSGPKV